MTFEETLQQAINILQNRGRVSYRALKRQFDLDEAYLEDLKEEILSTYPQVTEEAGRGLVWTGTGTTASPAEAERRQLWDRAQVEQVLGPPTRPYGSC